MHKCVELAWNVDVAVEDNRPNQLNRSALLPARPFLFCNPQRLGLSTPFFLRFHLKRTRISRTKTAIYQPHTSGTRYTRSSRQGRFKPLSFSSSFFFLTFIVLQQHWFFKDTLTYPRPHTLIDSQQLLQYTTMQHGANYGDENRSVQAKDYQPSTHKKKFTMDSLYEKVPKTTSNNNNVKRSKPYDFG